MQYCTAERIHAPVRPMTAQYPKREVFECRDPGLARERTVNAVHITLARGRCSAHTRCTALTPHYPPIALDPRRTIMRDATNWHAVRATTCQIMPIKDAIAANPPHDVPSTSETSREHR